MIDADNDASDIDIPANGVSAHTESKVEADVDAKDQLKDDLIDDIEATKGTSAAKAERRRVSPTNSNDDGDEEDEDEEEEMWVALEKVSLRYALMGMSDTKLKLSETTSGGERKAKTSHWYSSTT